MLHCALVNVLNIVWCGTKIISLLTERRFIFISLEQYSTKMLFLSIQLQKPIPQLTFSALVVVLNDIRVHIISNLYLERANCFYLLEIHVGQKMIAYKLLYNF